MRWKRVWRPIAKKCYDSEVKVVDRRNIEIAITRFSLAVNAGSRDIYKDLNTIEDQLLSHLCNAPKRHDPKLSSVFPVIHCHLNILKLISLLQPMQICKAKDAAEAGRGFCVKHHMRCRDQGEPLTVPQDPQTKCHACFKKGSRCDGGRPFEVN
jgi:hypothetical protein